MRDGGNEADEERKQRSDAARLAAMRERVERQKERSRIIADGIRAVDAHGKKPSKIVFDSDDDEDDDSAPSDKAQKKAENEHKALFDDSDEDGDQISFANRHSGPKGEKLMKMEARYNSDPRFKLDDKFVDDESSSESEDEEERRQNEEKLKNKEMLSKVLGRPLNEKKQPKKSVLARPFTRFNPENEDHLRWLNEFKQANEEVADKKKRKKAEEEEGEEEKEEEEEEETQKVDEDELEADEQLEDGEEEDYEDLPGSSRAEMFYQLDAGFSTELKEKANAENGEASGGFSFLAMMGRRSVIEKEDAHVNGDVLEQEWPMTTKEPPTKKAKASRVVVNNSRPAKFFLDADDEHVKSMVVNFRRTQSIQKVIDSWTPYRDAISKIWKKQRKMARKKEDSKPDWRRPAQKTTTAAKNGEKSSSMTSRVDGIKGEGRKRERTRKRKTNP